MYFVAFLLSSYSRSFLSLCFLFLYATQWTANEEGYHRMYFVYHLLHWVISRHSQIHEQVALSCAGSRMYKVRNWKRARQNSWWKYGHRKGTWCKRRTKPICWFTTWYYDLGEPSQRWHWEWWPDRHLERNDIGNGVLQGIYNSLLFSVGIVASGGITLYSCTLTSPTGKCIGYQFYTVLAVKCFIIFIFIFWNTVKCFILLQEWVLKPSGPCSVSFGYFSPFSRNFMFIIFFFFPIFLEWYFFRFVAFWFIQCNFG